MTTTVVPVPPQARPGDTVMVDDHPFVLLHLLPRLVGHPMRARVTADPPCPAVRGAAPLGAAEALLALPRVRRRAYPRRLGRLVPGARRRRGARRS